MATLVSSKQHTLHQELEDIREVLLACYFPIGPS